MNIILIGTGRMGRLLKECALDAGDAVVGEYGRANIAELAAAPAADRDDLDRVEQMLRKMEQTNT